MPANDNHSLVTDAELLFRYVHSGDNAAFCELVETHFPLVFGVCRQVLQHDADAEDACQATFIILARQGHKVRDPNSLAGWLYRVAYRVSCSVRKASQRIPTSEATDLQEDDGDVLSRICHRETLLVLHEELNQLPQRYRVPIILHYLESQTREQTATQLDATDASIKARLARGRRLLRSRLMRRGVALSIAMTLAHKALARDAVGSQHLPETIAATCLGQADAGITINSRSESLAYQEIGRMNLSSIARAAFHFI